MNLDGMSFFRLASQRMEWLASRQKVIAENVANANTPGFRARDVEGFDAYLARHDQAGAAQGDGSSLFAPTLAAEVGESEDAWGQSPDGNTVVLEQQTILASETEGQYRLATRLYAKGYELLTLAGSKG